MAKINARYEQIYEWQTLIDSWNIVSKDERYSGDKVLFQADFENNMLDIQRLLKTKTYKPDPYQKFEVCDPKRRQIDAPSLRDRIVQVALCMVIEVDIDLKFDYDSYGCRKDKGNLRAANRISYYLNQPSSVYFLYGDIRKCFPSVDTEKCLEIIRSYYIDDENILWLIKSIMANECPTGIGLKIGNRWSQLAINIYLNELDRFFRELGYKKIVRSADDFVLIHSKIKKLSDDLPKINQFLKVMNMELNPKSYIGRCKNGITFCGYIITAHNKVVRKHVFDRTKQAIKAWKAGSTTDLEFCNSMASRVGHCEGTSSYKWYCKILLQCLRFAIVDRVRIQYN